MSLEPLSARELARVSFARFAQYIDSISLYHIAMCGFDTKLILDLLNKCRASNRNPFRPAIIADRQAVLQTVLNPLALCPLKISDPQPRSTRLSSVSRLWRNAWAAFGSHKSRSLSIAQDG